MKSEKICGMKVEMRPADLIDADNVLGLDVQVAVGGNFIKEGSRS